MTTKNKSSENDFNATSHKNDVSGSAVVVFSGVRQSGNDIVYGIFKTKKEASTYLKKIGCKYNKGQNTYRIENRYYRLETHIVGGLLGH